MVLQKPYGAHLEESIHKEVLIGGIKPFTSERLLLRLCTAAFFVSDYTSRGVLGT